MINSSSASLPVSERSSSMSIMWGNCTATGTLAKSPRKMATPSSAPLNFRFTLVVAPFSAFLQLTVKASPSWGVYSASSLPVVNAMVAVPKAAWAFRMMADLASALGKLESARAWRASASAVRSMFLRRPGFVRAESTILDNCGPRASIFNCPMNSVSSLTALIVGSRLRYCCDSASIFDSWASKFWRSGDSVESFFSMSALSFSSAFDRPPL